MEKEKKEIKISLWTFYVLVAAIVVLVGAVVIGALNVQKQQNNKQNGETVGNNEQGQQQVADVDKVEQLNVNSELVQELHEYVTNYEPNNLIGFYKNEKTTENNLDEDVKLLTVLNTMLCEKDYTVVKKETLKKEMYEYGEVYTLELDESYYYNYETNSFEKENATTVSVTEDIYEFSLSDIQEKAKEIFNNTIQIQEHSFMMFGEAFVYDDNMYKYIIFEGGGGDGISGGYSKITKAETKGKELYIYDQYIKIVGQWDNPENYDTYYIYATSDNRLKIAEIGPEASPFGLVKEHNIGDRNEIVLSDNAKDIINTTLPQYKHTFKQADNGEYYWVSTELINKNELKIVE